MDAPSRLACITACLPPISITPVTLSSHMGRDQRMTFSNLFPHGKQPLQNRERYSTCAPIVITVAVSHFSPVPL